MKIEWTPKPVQSDEARLSGGIHFSSHFPDKAIAVPAVPVWVVGEAGGGGATSASWVSAGGLVGGLGEALWGTGGGGGGGGAAAASGCDGVFPDPVGAAPEAGINMAWTF